MRHVGLSLYFNSLTNSRLQKVIEQIESYTFLIDLSSLRLPKQEPKIPKNSIYCVRGNALNILTMNKLKR